PVGSGTSFSANHSLSMLTHTSPTSTADNRCSRSTAYRCGPRSASGEVYGWKTPSDNALDANVESMPYATSAIGLSLVSTSLFVSSPASPSLRTSIRTPARCSKASTTSCGTAQDWCVTRVTVTGSSADSSSVPITVQPAVRAPADSSAIAARNDVDTWPGPWPIQPPRRDRAGGLITFLRRHDPNQVRTVVGHTPTSQSGVPDSRGSVQRTRRPTTIGP